MFAKDKEMQSFASHTPRTPQNCTANANQILPSIASDIASSPPLPYWLSLLVYRSVNFLSRLKKATTLIKRRIEPSV